MFEAFQLLRFYGMSDSGKNTCAEVIYQIDA
jgi:hypothetical protein